MKPRILSKQSPWLRQTSVIFVALIGGGSALATDGSWDGSEGDANWGTTLNWSGLSIPGTAAGETATFDAPIANTWGDAVGNPIVIDNIAGQPIKSITFTSAAGNYFIGSTGGNKLALETAGTISIAAANTAASAIQTINAPLEIQGAAYTLNNASVTVPGTLNIGGAITGGVAGPSVLTINGANTTLNTISGLIGNGSATSLGIVKADPGTWYLANTANSFTGQVQINNGTLKVEAIKDAGQLSSLGAAAAGADSVIRIGTNNNNNVTLEYTGASATTTDRQVQIGSGTSANTGGGTISNNNALPANSLKFTNAAFNVAFAGTGVRVMTLAGSNTGGNEIQGAIINNTGNIGVTKTGAGTWTLSGANAYNGPTVVNDGKLINGSATTFTNDGALTASGTGIFDLNGFDATFNGINVGAATATITNSSGGSPAVLTSSSQTIGITSLISGNLSFRIANNGTSVVVLPSANANTFTGGLILLHNANNGTRLRVTDLITTVGSPGAITSSPFGTGPITIGLAATDKAGIMIGTATNNTLVNDLIVNTAIGGGNPASLRIDSTGHVFSGTLTANLADLTFCSSDVATGSVTITGKVTGSLGLRLKPNDNSKSSVFDLTLSTSPGTNDYLGDTTVVKPTLVTPNYANYTLHLGANDQIPHGLGKGNVTLDDKFTLDGFSETINGLSGTATGVVDGGTGTPTLTLGDNDAAGSFSGVIRNTAGTLALTKTGSGTQTLGGANTYTGNTLVNAGTLALSTGAQLKFVTGPTSGTGHNVISGAGTVTLDGNFDIDTSATDATALTSGSWQIENAASLPGAYGGTFTVVGWNDEGDDTWTKTVGTKNYTFNELDGTVSMLDSAPPADPYLAWIATFEPNALLPDAASKLPGADPDGDDYSNLMEFVLDGSPVVSSQSIRPNQTVNATDIILTFKRSDASESPVSTQMVQISTDLVDWTTIPAITIGAGDNLPAVGVAENGAAADDITVTIPRSGSLKKFVRLNVVK
jgi:autotransporter-associated beta strand protein